VLRSRYLVTVDFGSKTGEIQVMKIDDIVKRVNGIPHMTLDQGQAMTNFILENKFQNILELGFRHGVSTCYMAGALDELGQGRITTIDLANARNATPNVESLLTSLGLRDFVTIHYEPTSYTWRLMKMLEEGSTEKFDFCYVDGAHNWFVDGFAFFLVDRFLAPGGWIIFDDLDWSYALSPSMRNTDIVKSMPQEEREIPQVRKVYELLVKHHPSYGDFTIKDGWAYARKKFNTSTPNNVEQSERALLLG
jgi:predicted O-methyltransferase YrrM